MTDNQKDNKLEISLVLKPLVVPKDNATNQLFFATKKEILKIARVQPGKNLVEILRREITPEDEKTYSRLYLETKGDKKALAASNDSLNEYLFTMN